MTTRRDFCIGTTATLAATQFAGAATKEGGMSAESLLAEISEQLLATYPENATALGIDNAARVSLKSKLSDRSARGQEVIAAQVRQSLARLKAIDAAKLDAAARIDVDVVRTAFEFALEGFAFPYGDVALLNLNWSWRNAPYVVAQNTGAFLEIPGLLDEQHTVNSREDADAYLARMEAYAGQLDGETGRLKSAAAQKVIAPDFLLDKTLNQIRMARGGEWADWTLVSSIAKRGKSFPGVADAAGKIAKEKIAPALDRQIAELEAHRRQATSDAGVWKLPRGDEYYAWALRAGTTTRMTPDEVHRRGQEELRELQSRMDAILKKEGFTQGSVGERMFKLPLCRSLLAFNAYSEGWALYAEQLGDELGCYDDDPFGRLGYLQSIAFRACRLVVDTGLHAKRWTRQQAIDWFARTNGSSVAEVTGEVDRYCAWPGQACGYKVGHSEINRLRTQAKSAMGARFDFRKFNDALVIGGGVPMTTLARNIDAFIAGR